MIHFIFYLQNVCIIKKHMMSISSEYYKIPIVLNSCMSISGRRFSISYSSIRTSFCFYSLILMRFSFSHLVIVTVKACVCIFNQKRIHHFLWSWWGQYFSMIFLHFLFQHFSSFRRRKLRCFHWAGDWGKALRRKAFSDWSSSPSSWTKSRFSSWRNNRRYKIVCFGTFKSWKHLKFIGRQVKHVEIIKLLCNFLDASKN